MSDKSQTPTGVFVRLPLSEEQRRVMYDVAGDVSMETAILAIGTPVSGGEFYPVGYIAEDAIGGLAAGIYQSASIFRDEDKEHHDTVALVRLESAQAALAAAQAEIVQLREIIRTVDGLILGNNDPIKMFVAIHSACQSALKGPEA